MKKKESETDGQLGRRKGKGGEQRLSTESLGGYHEYTRKRKYTRKEARGQLGGVGKAVRPEDKGTLNIEQESYYDAERSVESKTYKGARQGPKKIPVESEKSNNCIE